MNRPGSQLFTLVCKRGGRGEKDFQNSKHVFIYWETWIRVVTKLHLQRSYERYCDKSLCFACFWLTVLGSCLKHKRVCEQVIVHPQGATHPHSSSTLLEKKWSFPPALISHFSCFMNFVKLSQASAPALQPSDNVWCWKGDIKHACGTCRGSSTGGARNLAGVDLRSLIVEAGALPRPVLVSWHHWKGPGHQQQKSKHQATCRHGESGRRAGQGFLSRGEGGTGGGPSRGFLHWSLSYVSNLEAWHRASRGCARNLAGADLRSLIVEVGVRRVRRRRVLPLRRPPVVSPHLQDIMAAILASLFLQTLGSLELGCQLQKGLLYVCMKNTFQDPLI